MSQPIRIQEFTRVTKAAKIDRDAGIIHGLVILGPESANGRRYSESAMRAALPLYNGRPSNANHTRNGVEPSIYDRVGVWSQPYFEDGKIKGNFHYLKSHPLSERLLEAAERPDLHMAFGFSHDALGSEKPGSNGELIEAITEVFSVDLVADPATVRGVWESRNMTQTAPPPVSNKPKTGTGVRTKKTFRTILLEALAPTAHRKKRAAFAAWLKEWDGAGSSMNADDTMEATPGAGGDDLDTEPPAHGKDFLQSLIDQISDRLSDADKSALHPDYMEVLEAGKDLFQSFIDDNAGDNTDQKPADTTSQESRKPKKPAAAAALREEMRQLRAENTAIRLAAEAGIKLTALQLKAVTHLTEAEIRDAINEHKTALQEAAQAKGTPPPVTPPANSDRRGRTDTPPPPAIDKPKDGNGLCKYLEQRARAAKASRN